MFPMVTTVEEVREANALLDHACDGRPDGLRVGIMVEVPAVALKAAAFTPYLDFFSVGTSDLTQYALAAERGLGVRTLSVPPPAIATVKQAVRGVHLGEAGELARRALTLASAAGVRAMPS